MTAGAFLSDRLGRLVLWLTSMAVGALFLLCLLYTSDAADE